MSIAIYSRVSHKTQDNDAQDADLKKWAESQAEPVKWFRDKFSGKGMERPGWDKLSKAIQAGKVKTLVVWRMDRLGRTAKGLTALFVDLQGLKVNLISLRDGVDLSTAAGRMLANVLASIAQFETEVRSERQLAGIAVAKAKGVRFGPEPGKYKGRRLKVSQEQEQVIRRMKGEGGKIAAIARATGLSRPTVYSVLGDDA